MIAPDDELMLHALVDGELDVVSAIKMERRIADDPELSAAYARLVALRGALRSSLSREAAPDALRARVMASVADAGVTTKPAARMRDRLPWPAVRLAASLALAAGLAGYFAAPRENPESETMKALLSAHRRGQVSERPVDVASSDRHTVKPWLAAKLPVSVVVIDLVTEGFPLIGGRIDIVAGAAAPTLVYKRREHLISLTQLPARERTAKISPAIREGYSLERWSDGERGYVAISDLSPSELQGFAGAFRAAAARDAGGQAVPPK
jgi:anti-sigma factor RsiW